MPPLMGWTAATNELALGGWIVFGILFLWQLPHFMAISWMYREDYARGGFAMLSVRDDDGAAVARQAIYYTLALLAVSVAPSLLGMTGTIYLVGAALCRRGAARGHDPLLLRPRHAQRAQPVHDLEPLPAHRDAAPGRRCACVALAAPASLLFACLPARSPISRSSSPFPTRRSSTRRGKRVQPRRDEGQRHRLRLHLHELHAAPARS